MWLFKKDMYQYNLFERVKIDFIKEQQNSKVKVEKVCDNDKYIFYKYTPDDVYNCDMNFKIVFRIENNNFVPYFITAEKEFRFCKN